MVMELVEVPRMLIGGVRNVTVSFYNSANHVYERAISKQMVSMLLIW